MRPKHGLRRATMRQSRQSLGDETLKSLRTLSSERPGQGSKRAQASGFASPMNPARTAPARAWVRDLVRGSFKDPGIAAAVQRGTDKRDGEL